MIKSFLTKSLFAAATVCLLATETRADELFSRVSINSVFGSTSQSAPAGNPQAMERGQRIGTTSQLSDMLRDAGLEPESDNERIVSVKLQHAKWTFPVSLGINEAGDQIRLAMTLSQFEAGKQPTANQLLALLGANREHQPAFFSFSEKRRQIELFLSIDNDQITPRRMREELRRAAGIAESTASLWDISGGAQVTTTAPAVAQNSAVNTNNLVGKWSAARSNTQAFAMQFKADGTFILVSVINGKQSKATGKFALTASQLTLTTDNGTSTASLSNVSGKSFDFTPPGKTAAKLTFKRAS